MSMDWEMHNGTGEWTSPGFSVAEGFKPETMTPTMWWTCKCGVRTLAIAADAGTSLWLDLKVRCKCGRVAFARSPAHDSDPETWPVEPPWEPGLYWAARYKKNGELMAPDVTSVTATGWAAQFNGHEGFPVRTTPCRWRPGQVHP